MSQGPRPKAHVSDDTVEPDLTTNGKVNRDVKPSLEEGELPVGDDTQYTSNDKEDNKDLDKFLNMEYNKIMNIENIQPENDAFILVEGGPRMTFPAPDNPTLEENPPTHHLSLGTNWTLHHHKLSQRIRKRRYKY
jgi:hypothetical protein